MYMIFLFIFSFSGITICEALNLVDDIELRLQAIRYYDCLHYQLQQYHELGIPFENFYTSMDRNILPQAAQELFVLLTPIEEAVFTNMFGTFMAFAQVNQLRADSAVQQQEEFLERVPQQTQPQLQPQQIPPRSITHQEEQQQLQQRIFDEQVAYAVQEERRANRYLFDTEEEMDAWLQYTHPPFRNTTYVDWGTLGNAIYNNSRIPERFRFHAIPVRRFQLRDLVKQKRLYSCAICHGEIKLFHKKLKLKCHDFFHSQCLLHWLNVKDECPVCRRIAVGSFTDQEYEKTRQERRNKNIKDKQRKEQIKKDNLEKNEKIEDETAGAASLLYQEQFQPTVRGLGRGIHLQQDSNVRGRGRGIRLQEALRRDSPQLNVRGRGRGFRLQQAINHHLDNVQHSLQHLHISPEN